MQMSGGQGGQDWNSVVFSKKHTGAAASASKNVRAVSTAFSCLAFSQSVAVLGHAPVHIRWRAGATSGRGR